MGRVYKALVRAERWKDTERPIGRPEHNGTAGRDDAAQVFSINPSSATAPFVFDDNPDLTQDFSAAGFSESSTAVESTKFPAAVAVPARVPRPGGPLVRRTVSETPATSAPVVTFEEPTEVLSIRDLAVDPHVAALKGEDSSAMASYSALSAKLLNLAARRKLKTFLITSAQSGAGTTTIATGAAWSLAKGAERRVLLIDASSASSSVARMLGIEPKLGWLNLLDGSSELKQALIRLEPNGLYVLTAGATAAGPFAEAASSRLQNLIAEMASRFDLVIVDSGSLLESPEAQHLATVLDGVVIVARANHTHHSKVTAARKLIPKERRLGVVLNDSELDAAEITHRRIKGRGLVGRLFGRKR